jgi:NAD(P)H-flavin reductase
VTDEGQRGAKLLGEQVPLLDSGTPEQTSDEDVSQEIFSDSKTMTFLIRPYDGFTSRLRDTASAEWPKNIPQRVLVDGPYGHTQPLHLFDNVIFVVGGSGIVVPLSYLQLLTGSPSSPRTVKIHWAVREPAFALDVLKTDIADALGSASLSIEIHLTTHTPQDELQEWPTQVVLRRGRIDAAAVVTSASDKVEEESLAVVACGPAQMADDARRTVSELLKRGLKRVEYFEESFQW